jgi:hypothetical protein
MLEAELCTMMSGFTPSTFLELSKAPALASGDAVTLEESATATEGLRRRRVRIAVKYRGGNTQVAAGQDGLVRRGPAHGEVVRQVPPLAPGCQPIGGWRPGTPGQAVLSVGGGMLAREMARHTTFKFCIDPTVEQQQVLARHAGASRFAFNQCLRMVKTALTARKTDPTIGVPWTGFDLINAFNAWKRTKAAGRTFTVDTEGTVDVVVTGLAWRGEVCQQVFEEAAVDLGKGLQAWSDSRCGKRNGTRVGFPRFKKKTGAVPSFRLRNKHLKAGRTAIRIGDNGRPRSVTCRVSGPCACMTTPGGCAAC